MVYALVLAAGRSRRFGGDKLLAGIRGVPLLAHVVGPLSRAHTDGTLAGGLVVLPLENPGREAIVRQSGLEYAFNPVRDSGVAESIRIGLIELASRHPDAEAALVFQGDQPAVNPGVMTRLISAWQSEGRPVVRPRYMMDPEKPGHPVLLERSIWARADELRGDTGFAPMLNNHPELVTTVDVQGTNPDINIPSDLTMWELGKV